MNTTSSSSRIWFGKVPARPCQSWVRHVERGFAPGCRPNCRLRLRPLFLMLTFLLLGLPAIQPSDTLAGERALEPIITELSRYEDRSSGSAGSEQAAAYIFDYFENLGLSPQTYRFQVPVRQRIHASITVNGRSTDLQPLLNNAVTPQTTDGSLQGPLFWVGSGSLQELDQKLIEKAILLMDFNSGRSWLTAASLGASAVIFIDREVTRTNSFFREKEELSPLQFPSFWMQEAQARELFGDYTAMPNGLVSDQAAISSQILWRNATEKNIYCIIEGADPELAEELIIIEAFYDSTAYVRGRSPGADESVSIASLLKLAEHFAARPPPRSLLLVATSGHAQSLHGMRELIWSMQERTKNLRDQRRELKKRITRAEETLTLISELSFPLAQDFERDQFLAAAIENDLRFAIDKISKELMQLRMDRQLGANEDLIDSLAKQRFSLRRLSWATSFHDLAPSEREDMEKLLPAVVETQKADIDDFTGQLEALESALDFRKTTRDFTISAIFSLHLSSHGEGIGGFHRGWLYRLRPRINRVAMFSTLAEVFETTASADYGSASYINSLRPSTTRTWDSYFLDQPFLGGEVSSLAGYIGVTLTTIGDARSAWGTPWDTPEQINWDYLDDQFRLLTDLIGGAGSAEALHIGLFPRNGFSSVSGISNLLLQGELFANYPTSDAVLLSYQGIAKLYGWVNRDGTFIYKGIADKKNVFDKLIIEGYRFDEQTGKVVWAIDKKETTKDNYRVKMQRRAMKTRLVMFACDETTIFDLLEPRSLNHMTKLYLFDGRRDAPPQRYWYSRIDTRESIISSIYLEPGSRLKLTLSDNVLTRKLILSNADLEHPLGTGYPMDEYPKIINTIFRSAQDAWSLLDPADSQPRIARHFRRSHQFPAKTWTLGPGRQRAPPRGAQLHRFPRSGLESLALAARVYTQIEKTQKDVLFGVLFYIALFVPFAFCMERFLFGYASIYKRITAFCLILVALIAIIYNVHPAFELAYSPMVVILAFFIIGLSLMVTLIIFFRFEEEMILLQRHASHMSAAKSAAGKPLWPPFSWASPTCVARRIRTILTCSTLIILTFTIMSFTTVKSNVQENRCSSTQEAPYHGLLLKKLNWQSMPPQAIEIWKAACKTSADPAPRIWLEAADPTRSIHVPLRHGQRRADLQGLVGLSHLRRK
jgi:hypothetical protein